MKILKLALGFFMCFLMTSTVTIKAHPGRTDGNGCHVCRTNCSAYGLGNGEYHCHNGGSSNQVANPPASTPPPATPSPIYTAPTIDYAALGKADGYTFKKNNPNASLEEATYQYSDATYMSEYKTSFATAQQELTSQSITLASENAKKDATLYTDYHIETDQVNIIKSTYEENYKIEFDKEVRSIKAQLKEVANKNAFETIYNKGDIIEVNDYGLDHFKEYYNEQLKGYKDTYSNEKKDWLKKAETLGADDQSKDNKKDYSHFKNYENTKFYKRLLKAYDAAYDNAKKESGPSFIQSILSVGVVVVVVYVVVKARKNRKRA